MAGTKNSPAKLAALARAEYAKDEKDTDASYPYSPARATKAVAKKTGVPASRLVALVAGVFYAENGARSPISFGKNPTPKGIATEIRKRRDAGGRLGRWEVVAASASAGLGRPVSVSAVRAFYSNGGGDLDASYTGRGTRVGAPKTRESETVEVESAVA